MKDQAQHVIKLMNSGETKEAKDALTEWIRTEPANAQAWALMAELAAYKEQRRDCLKRVVKLAESDEMRAWAQGQLAEMGDAPSTDDDKSGTRPLWEEDAADDPTMDTTIIAEKTEAIDREEMKELIQQIQAESASAAAKRDPAPQTEAPTAMAGLPSNRVLFGGAVLLVVIASVVVLVLIIN